MIKKSYPNSAEGRDIEKIYRESESNGSIRTHLQITFLKPRLFGAF